MKVLLVDDEQLAIDVLEILLGKLEGIEIVGKYTDPQIAFQELGKVEVDALFLDMEMGGIHGLQFAEKLMTSFPCIDVVFVTAYPQFAMEAFEVNAIDYLLKPVNIERLTKAVSKIRERKKLYEGMKQKLEVEECPLFIRSMGAFHLLDSSLNEVKWRTKKSKELFAYLWHHRGDAIHRARIIEDLWPGLPDDRAATLLHTTVYQVRKKIKEMGINNPIKLMNEQYMLNVDVPSDYGLLKEILQSTQKTEKNIEKIMGLYQGHYVEEEDYHWALHEQSTLKRFLLNYFEEYISSEKKNKDSFYMIEHCLDKMIELEPYSENYIILLLRHYGETHNKQRMVAYFQVFKKMWIDELGLDLPQEIVTLYNEYIILDW
ncbi:response regulator [Sporosarcina limicola]|uniref:Two-component SAPR family response regulator n=1 Tax=Sporosarcina limicola TaxID=34101 RepID=A0A927MLM2_9BACL|nr:response regulator [Sporosarcina limicola]MBE1556630.1 two-component SAPR family response regulator [Sporosarcina limicola]